MADTKLVICEKCWGTGHVNGGTENSTWSKTCEYCHGIGFSRVPMTNADRIRALSDEELAEVLSAPCLGCVVKDCRLHNYGSGGCTIAFLKWLQKPSDEADHD